MKKQIILILILGLFLVNLVSAVPKIEPYVNDYANLMTPDQIKDLNIKLDNLENQTTWEIAVVTVPNTEGLDRVEYANRIGDENGVGKKDKDNGVVILWSQDSEKGGAIATGRYSESILNDAKVGRIGRDSRHFFDEGNYYQGFNYIIDQISLEIQTANQTIINNPSQILNPSSISSEIDSFGFFIGIIIFMFSLILIYFFIRNLREDKFESDSSFDNSDDGDDSKPDKSVYKYKKVNGKRKRYYLYGAVASNVLASRSYSSNYSSPSSSYSSPSSYTPSISHFGGGSFGGGGGRF